MLDPKMTPHSSPVRVSYGVPFVNIIEIIDRIITALHCSMLMATEVTTWMNNYIPLFYMDIIIYTCPNPDGGLADIY